jgi:hypothetical protein
MPVPNFTSGEVLTAGAMNNVGLWLVKTQTVGATVPSVTVTGAFSAAYDNYKIVYSNGASSNSTVIGLQFGSIITNYYFVFSYSAFATATALADVGNNTNIFTYSGSLHVAGGSGANIEVISPFLSNRFTYISNPCYSGNGTYAGVQTGTLADTSSITSFTLTANTGTMTGGTIRVYGYRN